LRNRAKTQTGYQNLLISGFIAGNEPLYRLKYGDRYSGFGFEENI
jgi:hypothetical protein